MKDMLKNALTRVDRLENRMEVLARKDQGDLKSQTERLLSKLKKTLSMQPATIDNPMKGAEILPNQDRVIANDEEDKEASESDMALQGRSESNSYEIGEVEEFSRGEEKDDEEKSQQVEENEVTDSCEKGRNSTGSESQLKEKPRPCEEKDSILSICLADLGRTIKTYPPLRLIKVQELCFANTTTPEEFSMWLQSVLQDFDLGDWVYRFRAKVKYKIVSSGDGSLRAEEGIDNIVAHHK